MDLFPDGRDRLIEGDCLEVARRIVPPRALALVYLDPPFGTGRPQRYRFGMGVAEPPLEDPADPAAWLRYWEPRIEAMAATLREGGILVVHLDPKLAHRARILLDERLGAANFLNEIVWHYRTGGVPRDRFPAKHDNLLVYRRSPGHRFAPLMEKRYLAHRVNRPGVEEDRDERGWFRSAHIDDVWDVPILPADSLERLGYPTQKPEELIVRLLRAFTIDGDPVADFACGSGTLPAAATRLGRRWIASDIDARAIACTGGRIARIRSHEISDAWNGAGVAGRRLDLADRIGRLRANHSSYGLTDAEAAVAAPALRIEALGDGEEGRK